MKAVHQGILDVFKARGVAVATFDELFAHRGDCGWSDVAAVADAFAAGDAMRHAQSAYRKRFGEWLAAGRPVGLAPTDYVLFHRGPVPRIPAGDRLFRLGLDRHVRAIVNGYLGCRTSLRQYDLFCNLPLRHPGRIRANAQRWHRDRWDQVKLFLYFSDVDGDNGALEYIPDSRRGDGPPGYLEPPEALIDASLSQRDRLLCNVPRGSLLFCDTSGLHRARLVQRTLRVLACWAFYPPPARVPRNFRCRMHPRET